MKQKSEVPQNKRIHFQVEELFYNKKTFAFGIKRDNSAENNDELQLDSMSSRFTQPASAHLLCTYKHF